MFNNFGNHNLESAITGENATVGTTHQSLDQATMERLWAAAKQEAIELEGLLDFHRAMSIYDELVKEELQKRERPA